ncbi:TldD/PmbA family protein [candidate division WOR-3 bacterium]|nr:TldD/PmbA family protein [candidate division WOR-3 bacterium]
MIDRKTIKDFLGGAEGAETEIVANYYNMASTRFSNNSITQNVKNEGMDLDLRVIESNRTSTVSSNDCSGENLRRLRIKALEVNKYSKEDEDILHLIDSSDQVLDDSAYAKKTAEMNPSERTDIIRECVGEASKKKMQAAGFLRNGEVSLVIATNKGMWREHSRTAFSLSLSVMNDLGSGWASCSSFDRSKVSIEEVVKIAVEKADASRKLEQLPPGAYTVVLEPAAVADLLAFLGWGSFGGLSFVENRSFMSGSIGKKVMSDKITITDNVGHELFRACPFDFDGLPTQKVVFIDKGVAKGVVHDRKTAAIAKTETTGHSLQQPNSHGPFPRALVMSSGDSRFEDMVSSTEKGILVTRFHYTNMLDPMKVTVTGMTRDGLFLIEKGKVTKALKNFRFTESVLNAFSQVDMVGDEQKLTGGFFGGGYVTPSLKISDFHFSSNTDF